MFHVAFTEVQGWWSSVGWSVRRVQGDFMHVPVTPGSVGGRLGTARPSPHPPIPQRSPSISALGLLPWLLRPRRADVLREAKWE